MTRIAVVDDDPVMIALLDDVLTLAGWDPIPRRSLDGIVDFVRQQQPDLVLLDVNWPSGPRGWEAVDALRRDPGTQGVPIIISSAAADQVQARSEWLRDRGVSSVTRPFDLPELYATVRQALKSPTIQL